MSDEQAHGQLPGIIASARDEHAEATSTASTIIRALSLGAIATVWLFAGSATSNSDQIAKAITAEPALAWALVMAVTSALLDVTHYLVAATLWGSYAATWGRVWFSRLDSTHRRVKWFMASFFNIDEYLIEAAYPPAQDDTRRELLTLEAKGRKKHAAEAVARYADDPRIRSYLDEPAAPRWISASISLLFLLKTLAAVISYVALLSYFLPLLNPVP